MAEPGGLPSTGSHRVGHDGSDLAVVGYFYSHLASLPLTVKFFIKSFDISSFLDELDMPFFDFIIISINCHTCKVNMIFVLAFALSLTLHCREQPRVRAIEPNLLILIL